MAIPATAAEVDVLRERTQQLVSELERRLRARLSQGRRTVARLRHALDVREHPALLIGVGVATSALLGVGIYFVVVQRRRRHGPLHRLGARLTAYRALLREPERALRVREPLGERLLAAVLVAAATGLARGIGIELARRRPRQLPA